MRSRFTILCQPSLNGIPFIFSPPLLYKPPPSFNPKDKIPLSSLLLSSSEMEWSCHILVFLRLKVLSETQSPSRRSSFPPSLVPPPRVLSSTIWILHECIIHFPNLLFLCCHDENLRLKDDSNYLNSLEYVWMFLCVLHMFLVVHHMFIHNNSFDLKSTSQHEKDVCLIILTNAWI